MKHMLFMIIGLSVLLYKASAVGSLQEEGFIGMNEKTLVQTIVPSPVYNFFEGINVLEKPQFVKYDETKKRGNIQWDDKEGYKGSIDMLLGSLYYMMFVAPFFLVYFGIKYFISNLYTSKTTSSSYSSSTKTVKTTQRKENKFKLMIKEMFEFIKETVIELRQKDDRNKIILILIIILTILLTIKSNF